MITKKKRSDAARRRHELDRALRDQIIQIVVVDLRQNVGPVVDDVHAGAVVVLARQIPRRQRPEVRQVHARARVHEQLGHFGVAMAARHAAVGLDVVVELPVAHLEALEGAVLRLGLLLLGLALAVVAVLLHVPAGHVFVFFFSGGGCALVELLVGELGREPLVRVEEGPALEGRHRAGGGAAAERRRLLPSSMAGGARGQPHESLQSWLICPIVKRQFEMASRDS